MEEIKLKPCPFCGGEAVVHVNDGVRVICKKCGSMTKCLVDGYSKGAPTGGALKSVVNAWNKRVGQDGFDKEKVIEKLNGETEIIVNDPIFGGRYINKNRAIEIVEEGGMSENAEVNGK